MFYRVVENGKNFVNYRRSESVHVRLYNNIVLFFSLLMFLALVGCFEVSPVFANKTFVDLFVFSLGTVDSIF